MLLLGNLSFCPFFFISGISDILVCHFMLWTPLFKACIHYAPFIYTGEITLKLYTFERKKISTRWLKMMGKIVEKFTFSLAGPSHITISRMQFSTIKYNLNIQQMYNKYKFFSGLRLKSKQLSMPQGAIHRPEAKGYETFNCHPLANAEWLIPPAPGHTENIGRSEWKCS